MFIDLDQVCTILENKILLCNNKLTKLQKTYENEPFLLCYLLNNEDTFYLTRNLLIWSWTMHFKKHVVLIKICL